MRPNAAFAWLEKFSAYRPRQSASMCELCRASQGRQRLDAKPTCSARSTCLRARWRASRSTSRCIRWTPSRPGCRRWRTQDSRCGLSMLQHAVCQSAVCNLRCFDVHGTEGLQSLRTCTAKPIIAICGFHLAVSYPCTHERLRCYALPSEQGFWSQRCSSVMCAMLAFAAR